MNITNTYKVISNKYGYFSCTSCSTSQVASEEVWVAQSNLIRKIYLMLNCLILWSSIWTGCSWNTRPSMTAMGSIMTAWSGYEMYCLSCEVRNTLCTCSIYIGRSSRPAIQFDLSINWHGLKDLDHTLVCSSTPLHPYLMKLSKKPRYIHERPGISFFYQHGVSIAFSRVFSGIFWHASPY